MAMNVTRKISSNRLSPPPMLTPYRLRELVLPNRIAVSPMCMYSATDGTVNDFHLVHLGSRAVGGAGLVLTEMTDVLPEGNIEFMSVVERVHMTNQLPDHKATEYDSTRDKIPPPGFEDAAKAVGVIFLLLFVAFAGWVAKDSARNSARAAPRDTHVCMADPPCNERAFTGSRALQREGVRPSVHARGRSRGYEIGSAHCGVAASHDEETAPGLRKPCEGQRGPRDLIPINQLRH
jgi:hypothetical protein